MKYCQFGSEHGRLVFYFHGTPGAPEECAMFDGYGKENDLMFICFDRFAIESAIEGEAYYQFLAKEILKKADGAKVDIIGFSMGAFIALQTCRCLADNVRSLHLVSAAAPMDAGDFLDNMAGKQIFRLAQTFPSLFALLSYWQGLLALLCPKALFRMLFANTAGEDKVLVLDRKFQSTLVEVLRSCFINRRQGYRREIKAYVQPWKTMLCEIFVNTHIWHGTEDNWSPKGMADYLSSAIPGCTHTQILNGLSHYSCLHEAAPKICKLLADSSSIKKRGCTP